jgi:hypothetical protein
MKFVVEYAPLMALTASPEVTRLIICTIRSFDPVIVRATPPRLAPELFCTFPDVSKRTPTPVKEYSSICTEV